jgi:hypothetical protein
LFIRATQDGRTGSKMDVDPKKFGYIVEEGKPWQSDSMSFDDALRLVRKIYTTQSVLEKAKFSAATWIGRILSLGYTVEEVFAMINSKQSYNSSIFERTDNMKQNYFDNLLNL